LYGDQFADKLLNDVVGDNFSLFVTIYHALLNLADEPLAIRPDGLQECNVGEPIPASLFPHAHLRPGRGYVLEVL
jgi:hypothetical protein